MRQRIRFDGNDLHPPIKVLACVISDIGPDVPHDLHPFKVRLEPLEQVRVGNNVAVLPRPDRMVCVPFYDPLSVR